MLTNRFRLGGQIHQFTPGCAYVGEGSRAELSVFRRNALAVEIVCLIQFLDDTASASLLQCFFAQRIQTQVID